MDKIMQIADMLLNSWAVVTVIAGFILTYIVRWASNRYGEEEWRKYAGRLIDIIKAVERLNPNMDGANKMVLVGFEFAKIVEDVLQRELTNSEKLAIEGEISNIHAKLESGGQLKKEV